MFPTRARALFSTQFRRQTTTPGSNGGMFNLNTPAGKNNVFVATAAVVTLLGGSYYMGYWDTDKAKNEVPVKKD
ncbi:hypothetical protein C8R43DRAFT_1124861 [Mycena crocata]|nr:hypothetical protein C8R43DRAFT_1124861 [Mycena crocata]